MTYKIIYDKARFPKKQRRLDGTYGCRGCGKDIPKGRESWCSKECYNLYEPSRVINAVKLRDKGICQICNYDIFSAERNWQYEYGNQCRNSNGSDWQHSANWKKSNPRPHKANYDHVVPFCEGGMTVLENMRTLCEPCHKQRTKDWHGQRKNRVLP